MSATFHIITFGCQMNMRDSEWLSAMLQKNGMLESSPEEADIILINTCSVREKPEKKVKNTIQRLKGLCKREPVIGILGCVAQQLGEKLYEFSPNIRLLAGGDGLPQVPQAVSKLLQGQCQRLQFLDFSPNFPDRELLNEKSPTGAAQVNIMQGCDNFCAYCIVPFTRGRQKSRNSADILAECSLRLANGACDISLLGQNVNAYGLDRENDEIPFPSLLEKVAALPGLERLRFVVPHPKDLGDQTIGLFQRLPNLSPRLHLPLQSGSDHILQIMGRHYSSGDYLKLVEKLRLARADIALSTDLIVGFPGESEKDFEDTLKMMRECGFMASYSFCYSDRPGTRASLMLDKIAPEVMRERLTRLEDLQEELGSQWLEKRVGQTTSLLLECKSPLQKKEQGISWQGRDPWGVIAHVDMPEGNHGGKMLAVRISGAKKHSLLAKIIA